MFSPSCPVCGALLGPPAHGLPELHAEWHYATRTLNGWSVDGLVSQVREQVGLAMLAAAGDDAPTAKLPPITDTVRRRPPVPPPAVVRELRGADLLRALAQQLEHEDPDELAREDLNPRDLGLLPDGTPDLGNDEDPSGWPR